MSGVAVGRPALLLLLLLGPLLVVAWRRWPPPLPPGRRRVATGLRLALLVLLVSALADVRISRQPDRRAVVAVVDLSESARSSQEQAAAAVTDMIRSKGPDDLFGVVTFGRDAQVELPPSRTPVFSGFQTHPDGSYSDLGGALILAGNLIPDGYSRQVVLVSDGRQNLGDAAQAVASLRRRSVRADVLPLEARSGGEVAVLALEAPHDLRAGQALTATARLRASQPATGKLTFLLDDAVAAVRDVELPAGGSEQRLDLPPLEPGTHTMKVLLDAQPDGYAQNDVADAVVKVLGRPSVLVLEGDPGAGANVRASLAAAGMDVETRRAQETPTDMAALAHYDSFVVVDAQAIDFAPGALSALATAVRDLGRGLVSTGGIHAYGPGGWKGTPLEDVLPVSMDVQQPKQKPTVAVVLALETLESTQNDAVGLAAAEGVVDQMSAGEELGVIDMGNGGAPSFVVPLAPVLDKNAIKQKLRAASFGDTSFYSPALSMATDALSRSDAALKHIVVIGDGDAFPPVPTEPGYPALLAGSRAAGVTVSSIGIDKEHSPGAMDHMRSIADAGGGAFYQQSDSADKVPQFLFDETNKLFRPWYDQDPFFPKVTSAGDLLDGVPLDAFPQLGGYVATTAKPTADVLLTGPKGDPVLADGQFGLGRSVAWTSDAAGRWTAGFLRSPVSSILFGRMVAWSLPTGGADPIRIDATPSAGGLAVTVTGPAQGGDVQIRTVSPTGAASDQQLRPGAPGTWDGVVPTSEVGTHVLHAVLRRGGTAVGQAELSVPVPYPPEYLELGTDIGFLGQLAHQGGALLPRATSAWSQPRQPLKVTSPVFWVALLLAAVLWPIDIALRRLTLSPTKIIALARVEGLRRRASERPRRRAAAPRVAAGEGHRSEAPHQGPTRGPQVRSGAGAVVEEPPEPADAGSTEREPEKALATRLLEARRSRQEQEEER
jgi:uncharacterized membrane protein